MATMQSGPKAARPGWEEVMDTIRSGRLGDYADIRRAACDAIAETQPSDMGISSSDVSHHVYQSISFHVMWTGEWPTPAEAIALVGAA